MITKQIGTLENLIGTSLSILVKDFPNTAAYTLANNCFITNFSIKYEDSEKLEQHVIVDFKQKVRHNEDWYKRYSVKLLNYFESINEWYKC